jgi:hypothetical protein
MRVPGLEPGTYGLKIYAADFNYLSYLHLYRLFAR